MQNTRSHKRRRDNDRSKLPEWTKRLNASQRRLLTKFTKTGERDTRNRVTEERHLRRARWEAKQRQQETA